MVLNGQSAVTKFTPQRRCTKFEDAVLSATCADVRRAATRLRPGIERASSGDELERVAVCGTYDCEVTMVERGDGFVAEAFSDGDDRGVNEPKPDIGVGTDQDNAALVVVSSSEIDNRERDPATRVRNRASAAGPRRVRSATRLRGMADAVAARSNRCGCQATYAS